jgi:hypothetical protein
MPPPELTISVGGGSKLISRVCEPGPSQSAHSVHERWNVFFATAPAGADGGADVHVQLVAQFARAGDKRGRVVEPFLAPVLAVPGRLPVAQAARPDRAAGSKQAGRAVPPVRPGRPDPSCARGGCRALPSGRSISRAWRRSRTSAAPGHLSPSSAQRRSRGGAPCVSARRAARRGNVVCVRREARRSASRRCCPSFDQNGGSSPSSSAAVGTGLGMDGSGPPNRDHENARSPSLVTE